MPDLPRLHGMRTSALRLPIAAALLACCTVLTGCSDDAETAPSPAVHTADNGDVFNDADAEFAADLVQHHAMALTLVDLTRAASVSADVAALADEILSTESLEIETLTDWLAAWDVPAPETVRDHANAGHGDHHEQTYDDVPGADLPGMPSGADLTELAALRGPEFEQRWVDLMIAHHEGAIEIARRQLDDGTYAPALDLARSVEETQQAQVERMKALQAG